MVRSPYEPCHSLLESILKKKRERVFEQRRNQIHHVVSLALSFPLRDGLSFGFAYRVKNLLPDVKSLVLATGAGRH